MKFNINHRQHPQQPHLRHAALTRRSSAFSQFSPRFTELGQIGGLDTSWEKHNIGKRKNVVSTDLKNISQNGNLPLKHPVEDSREICKVDFGFPVKPTLVGGFNPFEKYESKWESSPIFGVKIKQQLKPPPGPGQPFPTWRIIPGHVSAWLTMVSKSPNHCWEKSVGCFVIILCRGSEGIGDVVFPCILSLVSFFHQWTHTHTHNEKNGLKKTQLHTIWCMVPIYMPNKKTWRKTSLIFKHLVRFFSLRQPSCPVPSSCLDPLAPLWPSFSHHGGDVFNQRVYD